MAGLAHSSGPGSLAGAPSPARLDPVRMDGAYPHVHPIAVHGAGPRPCHRLFRLHAHGQEGGAARTQGSSRSPNHVGTSVAGGRLSMVPGAGRMDLFRTAHAETPRMTTRPVWVEQRGMVGRRSGTARWILLGWPLALLASDQQELLSEEAPSPWHGKEQAHEGPVHRKRAPERKRQEPGVYRLHLETGTIQMFCNA